MHAVATGLLVAMAGLYALASSFERPGNIWGFVRAFAEAAMVGGLADWFAVTALFRHPLGLPIPHTAIIPRNKDRIGDNLASFLRDNFLTSSVVARRMSGLDVASALGRILAAPPRDGRLRSGGSKLAVTILEALDDEQLGTLAKSAAAGRLRALEISPVMGQMLTTMIAEGRHRPIIDAAILWAGRTLEANEPILRRMIHDRAGAILRWTGLDETLSNAILDGLSKMLGEMIETPDHPLRAKAEEGLAKLAHDLQHDPEMRARVERLKLEALANPAITGWLDRMWQSLREALIRAARDPARAVSGGFGEALRQLGDTLQKEPRLKLPVNRFTRRVTVGAVAAYGDDIVKLVSETIRGWNAQTITGRLEAAVGRDLQYIRINGTMVGGLVGLAIHMIEVLL
ncbi:DUF445 domain-containing protein [Sphingomonas oleivorans]|uniref:DUF445 domain-containing protein n=2 Tax=Sphingomonas oleivorans TaxID=1735121 RepID=A0A2T5G324_9SPHN|nr:DUF445 domain-containing protein [Sphingomonas oleivorans]PTQ13536.1 DUF445 domain-containing protein [Sphingomonas oleivorans]